MTDAARISDATPISTTSRMVNFEFEVTNIIPDTHILVCY